MNMLRRLAIIAVLTMILLLTNCGVATEQGLQAGETRPPSIWVENQKPHDMIVYDADSGMSLGRVTALQGRCIRLRFVSSGTVRLYAQPMRLWRGERTRAGEGRIDLIESPHWRWTISPADRDLSVGIQPGAACGRFQ